MLKFYFTLAIVAGAFYSFSQNQEEKTEVKQHTVQLITSNPQPKEATPSLEEQGFKPVMENNKLVYKKEVNGFIIEFIPE